MTEGFTCDYAEKHHPLDRRIYHVYAKKHLPLDRGIYHDTVLKSTFLFNRGLHQKTVLKSTFLFNRGITTRYIRTAFQCISISKQNRIYITLFHYCVKNKIYFNCCKSLLVLFTLLAAFFTCFTLLAYLHQQKL